MKRHKLDVLRQHCETVGRDYDEIVKSAEAYLCIVEPGDDPVRATAQARGAQSYEQFTRQFFVGTVEQIREHLHGYVDAGIEYVIVYLPRVAYDHEPIHRFEREIIPHFS
jgi:alkanesulfonate monooxygenase SsuD/methylene tetrahydromethanopterin reductase-like flavin-dependent oxidoreductase (luciferase family)